VGKTRLALQAAPEMLDEFPHGIWFVELEGLLDGAKIPEAIAAELDLHQEICCPILETIRFYLHNRHLLIILDNCEHLVEACSSIVETLLLDSTQVKFLITSREPLGISGETIFRVPSLSIPDSALISGLEELEEFESVRLFIDRASHSQPGFALTNQNASAVAQICYRLDGIPLALELASARVQMFTPDQIAERLNDRFRFLTGGSRTALPRQQTLRATIDWSHSLLTEGEKVLLRRLSVFRGSWTLDAAEEVCGNEPIRVIGVLDLLTGLVNKSLVSTFELISETRYRMLETIRTYAAEKLVEIQEIAHLRDRHLEFYINLSRDTELNLYDVPNQPRPVIYEWAARRNAEAENMRVALDWALDNHSPGGLHIAYTLGTYYRNKGNFSDGFVHLERALAAYPDESMELRAKVLDISIQLTLDPVEIRTFSLEYIQTARQTNNPRLLIIAFFWEFELAKSDGDIDRANTACLEAIELARKHGDQQYLAYALSNFGELCSYTCTYEDAKLYLEEALVTAKASGSTDTVDTISINLGTLAILRNDIEQANHYIPELTSQELELHIQSSVFHVLELIGRIRLLEGNLSAARDKFNSSISYFHHKGLINCLPHGLEAFARLALVQGQIERSITLLGAAQAILSKYSGLTLGLMEHALFDQTLKNVQGISNENAFSSAWELGLSMTIEQAVVYALQ